MKEEQDDVAVLGLTPLDDGVGPALHIGPDQSLAMVDAAVDAWLESSRPRVVPLPRRKRAPRVVWGAAAVVLVGGVAAAGYLQFREPPAPAAPAAPVALPKSLPSKPAVVRAEPAPAAPPAVTAVPEERATPEARHRVPRPHPETAKVAEDWMQRANELRAAGQWAEAERTYARVYREYPGSGGAYVARIAAATLRLEHLGDPAGARKLYRQVAGSGGALDVEVQTGIARASQRLGDRAGEVVALRQLVERHGGTRAAARAQERLVELGESE